MEAFLEKSFLSFLDVIVLLVVKCVPSLRVHVTNRSRSSYQPVQEIFYSHKIHAGTNKIECKYCHSSARSVETFGIPSLNVCMNCHKSIVEYNGEIDAEDVEAGRDKAYYDKEIKKLHTAAGWNVEKNKYEGAQKPVKWTRIHNLPDFVYFNHSQHVSVGKIECQTCHGPIEEMAEVYQYSPLTMGVVYQLSP